MKKDKQDYHNDIMEDETEEENNDEEIDNDEFEKE